MGSEANSSSSPSGKRSRDPEDEVYLDNLHSHKRYLSEVALSLPLPRNDEFTSDLSNFNLTPQIYALIVVSISVTEFLDIPVNTISWFMVL